MGKIIKQIKRVNPIKIMLIALLIYSLYFLATSPLSRISSRYMERCENGVEYGAMPEFDKCK